MTRAKADIALPTRPRCFPTAEECAVEFNISVNTWHKWVADERAPPAVPGSEGDLPRWRWADVDAWMSNPAERERIKGRYRGEIVAEVRDLGKVSDPFVQNAGKLRHVPPKDGRRGRRAAV